MRESKRRRMYCARVAAALAVVLAAAVAGVETRGGAAAQEGGAFAARVEGYMRQGGHNYQKVKANSWYINVKGKTLPQIRVLVGAGPNSIAVGAVVVPKARLRTTAEAMTKMLKLSYDFNYVRPCIDPDGDLIVMLQVKEKWLDQQEFNGTVERVAAAAERAHAEMQPFLGTP